MPTRPKRSGRRSKKAGRLPPRDAFGRFRPRGREAVRERARALPLRDERGRFLPASPLDRDVSFEGYSGRHVAGDVDPQSISEEAHRRLDGKGASLVIVEYIDREGFHHFRTLAHARSGVVAATQTTRALAKHADRYPNLRVVAVEYLSR